MKKISFIFIFEIAHEGFHCHFCNHHQIFRTNKTHFSLRNKVLFPIFILLKLIDHLGNLPYK